MKKLAAAFAMSLLLAGCASGGGGSSDRERFLRAAGKPVANPSALVKAELSFARLAREEGQWTAFRETATADAVMFVPDLSSAQVWLKGKADPAQAVDWQPHKIHMSCDGTMGVSTGAWQAANGSTGSFITIWEKQDARERRSRGKDDDWKWVFDHGVPAETPLPEPDFVETEVASCSGKPAPSTSAAPENGKKVTGQSLDGSFQWAAVQGTDRRRTVTVSLWDGEGYRAVIEEDFGIPQQ